MQNETGLLLLFSQHMHHLYRESSIRLIAASALQGQIMLILD